MENSAPQTPIPTPATLPPADGQTGASDDTRTIVTVICLLLVLPIGLILMWFWTKWKLWVKLLITILPVALILLTVTIVTAVFNFVLPKALIGKIPNINNAEKTCLIKCYGNKNQEKCLLACLPPESLTGTPSPAPTVPLLNFKIDTSNWKTYTNETNKYSIQYPSETYLRLVCPNEELILQKRKETGIYRNDTDPKIQNTCARDFRYHLEIRVIVDPKFLDIPKNSTEYSVKTEQITIAGKNATKYTVTKQDQNEGFGPRWYQSILIPQGNTTMEIYFSDKENTALFDQILSTFQFLD